MTAVPSSPAITQASIAAIRHAGYEPVFCGEIATPALAHAALNAGEPAVVVTGSHIPFDRNGIKFYRCDGEMMKSDEEPVIGCELDFPETLFKGRHLVEKAPLPPIDRSAQESYSRRAVVAFDGMLSGMRIGHYQHSAAGRDELHALLEQLGAEIITFGRSEEFVPVDTEAVSEGDKKQAATWCAKYGLDALVSTDGDGDRPLLADEKGVFFRGDLAWQPGCPCSGSQYSGHPGFFKLCCGTLRILRQGHPYQDRLTACHRQHEQRKARFAACCRLRGQWRLIDRNHADISVERS